MRTTLGVVTLVVLFALLGCSGSQDPQDMGQSNILAGTDTEMPDLILTELRVSSWTAAGIAYSYTLKNVGSAPANLDGPTDEEYDNVSVQAYLSDDSVFGNVGDIPAGGTILGVSPLGYLDPGDTFSGEFSATPDAAPCSKPYLVMKVDWGQVVEETDETNNTLAAAIDFCRPRIDIKPGSDINPVNLKSRGVIPVAILGSETFDVTAIDETTITFGPAGATIAHRHAHLEDVNQDGLMDMLVHFRTQETGIAPGDSEACLSAALYEGRVITACDNIRIVTKEEM